MNVPDGWEMNNTYQLKPISEIAKVITSPVDKKSLPDELPVFLCNYTDVYYNSVISKNMNFMGATAKQSEIDRFSLKPEDVVITKDFLKMPIWIPDLEKQKNIGGFLGSLDQEIDLLKQLTEKYKTQKRGLMQKLLTGEWRVKVKDKNIPKREEFVDKCLKGDILCV